MRILSQTELQRTGLHSEIPVDLSAQYFPIVLRAFTSKEGENLIDHDHVNDLFSEAKSILDCETLAGVTRDSKYPQEKILSTHRMIARPKAESVRTEFKTLNVMFPVDRLVFQEELAREKITATPGMLYFRAHYQFVGGRYSSRGSHYLNEESYEKSVQRKRPSQGAGRHDDDDEPEAKQKKWRGPVADLEHLTNSRVVGKKIHHSFWCEGYRESRDLHHYVLETPFDFPPGFVHESLNVFTRRWAKISKAAKLFCDLVSGSSIDSEESERKLEKRAALFPHGISHHRGPDAAWQQCEKPWFIQTMLLARIIGGRYWHYALGFLESKMRNGDIEF